MDHRIAAGIAGLALFVLTLAMADWGRSRLGEAPRADAPADTVAGLAMLVGLEPSPDGRTEAPDFTLPLLGGGTIRLADLKGQVVMVNFWATWCPPCRDEMPAMERLYRAYAGRGFTIVAVDYREGPEVVRPFVTGLGLTFPIGLDQDGAVTEGKYPTGGLPTTYILDRHGRAVARRLGFAHWDSAAARALIEALLAEPAAPSEAGSVSSGG